jgi:hypothetical protein
VRIALRLWPIIALVAICSAKLDGRFISGNAGIASATMRLTGTETLTISSNSEGLYSFQKLKVGKYAVTPSLSGYRFNPPSISLTLSGLSVGSVSFTATAVLKKETALMASPASFTLKTAGAEEQLKVEATYSDESSQNVTSKATYASNATSIATVTQGGLVTAVGNGSATIIASFGGLASNVRVTVSISDSIYGISGSAGAGSATMSLSGTSSWKTTASNNDAYGFTGLAPGSYTVTPSLSGHTFSPASQSVTITTANVTGLNFTAVATPHSVDLSWGAGTIEKPVPGQVVVGYNVYRGSGNGGPYTKLNSSPVAALTYTDEAVSAGQTWYYVCSTVDNLGDVSGYSNQAAATVP